MKEIILTQDNFNEEIQNAKTPVLVDFWAPWCGPCRNMLPIVEELSEELDGQVKIGKVNVDEEEMLARLFNVRSIPMFVVFENGKPVRSFLGSCPKQTLIDFINGKEIKEEE
ncbi:MAG: thioredoxin [Clostridia bacterium]|nr:thioredoxin [Clostridia bacterium]